MSPEEVSAYPPRVITPEQREFYFREGYLHLESLIPSDRLERLRAATAEMIERSRAVRASNDEFVLEPDHSAERPRLRRLNCASDHHESFWSFAFESIVPDVVADLVGPDVKFRECMINFKAGGGGDEVRWHQDIPFYPHTNMTPLITLTCLEDVTPDMGPLMVIPGSHRMGLFEHYDEAGRWAGRISDEDLETLPRERAVSLTAAAGSVTLIHGCTVHGSRRNESSRWRPLLICGYSSADAFCYTPLGTVSKYVWQIVRGQAARYAHHEAVRIRVPPDWSGGYKSIFEDQKGEPRVAPYGS